ncbi:hypothetical protein BU15DRAFT_81483 [Melanogaster broomeanus]|nr:hypothetical protein BU15DRAFT_81483 [Melanogaster broomeanus]
MASKPHIIVTSSHLPWPLVDEGNQLEASYMSSLNCAPPLPQPDAHSLSTVDGPLYQDVYVPLHKRGSLPAWQMASVRPTLSSQASARTSLDVLFGGDHPRTSNHEHEYTNLLSDTPDAHKHNAMGAVGYTRWPTSSAGLLLSGEHTSHQTMLHLNLVSWVIRWGLPQRGTLPVANLPIISRNVFHTAGNVSFGGAVDVPNLQLLPVAPSTPGSMYSSGSRSLTIPVNVGSTAVSSSHIMSAPPPSAGQRAAAATDEPQHPVVLFHVSPKRSLGRRRGRRACAINVDAVSSMSTNASGLDPKTHAGMWVIGTKGFIASHIQKWHTKSREDRKSTKCQWDGCDAGVMLKDSIGRHIVNIHLGELLFCNECGKESPRKDVYEQHLERSEGCRAAGAAVTYLTEIKMIDAHEALKRRGAVRHA